MIASFLTYRTTMPIHDLYDQSPPERLSHYTDAGGTLGILNGGALWASHVRYLNDAREFVHAVDLAKAYVRHLQDASGHATSAVLLQNLMFCLESMPGNTFVLSFCADVERLSQWRGYCPRGGYCLVFNGTALRAQAQAQQFSFVQCVYCRVEQQRLVQEVIDEAVAFFPRWPSPPPPHTQEPNEQMRANWFASQWFFPRVNRLASAMKDPAFEEEREWRAVGGILKSGQIPQARVRGALLMPYTVLDVGRGQALSTCLSEIMIGPGVDPELAQFGIERLFQRLQIEGVSVTRSSAPYRVI